MAEKQFSMTSPAQIRLGRPTNQLDQIVRFYNAALGLDLLLEFDADQAGYAGAILGIPSTDFHLEFVSHVNGFTEDQIRPPTKDHLLVFYLAERAAYDAVVKNLSGMGCQPVPASNPHWDLDGITFEDPDGWRVVLMLKQNV